MSLKLNKKTSQHLILLFATLAFSYLFLQTVNIQITPGPILQKLYPHSITSSTYPQTTPNQKNYDFYLNQVAPKTGYTLKIKWGNIGKKLVSSGAIDLKKFQRNYADPQYQELLTYLTQTKNKPITITPDNAYFWVNTLWAMGLVQKSDVLGKGIMNNEYKKQLGNFASTGGWTLGSKKATLLYNSTNIVHLTPKQQVLVKRIADNIYRPCCGNPTSFPDCNHGMAILGLLEIMASQGASEKEMYQAALAFNSYWFANTYADLAYYFDTKQNTSWDKIDPKTILSAQYSSALGYQKIKKQIGTIPGAKSQGGSCGA